MTRRRTPRIEPVLHLGAAFNAPPWNERLARGPSEHERRMAELEGAAHRATRLDACLQLGIALLTLASMAMLASTGPLHRWGFVVGLLAQPFWFAASWRARQWGVFATTFFYTALLVAGAAARFTF